MALGDISIIAERSPIAAKAVFSTTTNAHWPLNHTSTTPEIKASNDSKGELSQAFRRQPSLFPNSNPLEWGIAFNT